MVQQVKNPTSVSDTAGSIPGLAQWVKGSCMAAGCTLDHRGWGCGAGWQLWLRFDP